MNQGDETTTSPSDFTEKITAMGFAQTRSPTAINFGPFGSKNLAKKTQTARKQTNSVYLYVLNSVFVSANNA